MKPLNRKKLLRILLYGGLFGVLSVALLVGYSYTAYHRPLQNPFHSQGKNAMWARHQWVSELKPPKEYARFAKHLQQHQITDVFFHVGPLDARGEIDPQKHPFARKLVEQMKQHYPELHIQAWIGQVEARGGGPLNLSDPVVIANIVDTARNFLDLGFDGIHYNIEPIYSGDQRWIELLQKTNIMTRQRRKLLSIASDEPELFYGAERLSRWVSKQAGFWKIAYYQQVAEQVDQIAVMMYDTALPTDWLYGHVVTWTTSELLSVLPTDITLFMGVPTYEEERFGFHPEAENMRSGIRGIQKGLKTFEASKIQHFGIAVYAEWTTDEQEWEVYRTTWLD